MSADLDAVDLDEDASSPAAASRRPLTVVLLCALAVGALAIAGTTGWLIGDHGSTSSVRANSVDAGFARDMSTHHTQAVEMAGYTRDHTRDPSIELVAYDIETAQYFELGEMQGWLDGWRSRRTSTLPLMSWMTGHNHLLPDGRMPGMASPVEMDKLETLTGRALDVYFLQLMIRHHQGGLPMARYALEHAQEPYVRNLAQKMLQNQSKEIVQMERLLRQRGGSPLPPPDD